MRRPYLFARYALMSSNTVPTSDRGVVVVAHEHAPTAALVTVVDEIRLGGIMDIAFTTAQ